MSSYGRYISDGDLVYPVDELEYPSDEDTLTPRSLDSPVRCFFWFTGCCESFAHTERDTWLWHVIEHLAESEGYEHTWDSVFMHTLEHIQSGIKMPDMNLVEYLVQRDIITEDQWLISMSSPWSRGRGSGTLGTNRRRYYNSDIASSDRRIHWLRYNNTDLPHTLRRMESSPNRHEPRIPHSGSPPSANAILPSSPPQSIEPPQRQEADPDRTTGDQIADSQHISAENASILEGVWDIGNNPSLSSLGSTKISTELTLSPKHESPPQSSLADSCLEAKPTIETQFYNMSQSVSDLETQNPPSRNISLGRRTWTRFQFSLERNLPIPIAWWPLDPPILDRDRMRASERSIGAASFQPSNDLLSTNCYTTALSESAGGGHLSLRHSTSSQSRGSESSNRIAPDHENSGIGPPDSGLGRRRADNTQQDNDDSMGPDNDMPPTQSKYILLCFDITKLQMNGGFQHECRLRQVEVRSQYYDSTVYRLFRSEYYAISGMLRRYISLRALAQINFVKQRPLGSDHLVRYFHSRTIGSTRDVDFIPGRVERLPLNEGRRQEQEWGLHFVEGINFLGIFVVIGLGLFGGIGCGVGVAVVYQDMSKGATLGGAVVAVVGILATCGAVLSKI
ncbi:hypothetical protein BDD12DRAFT_930077 [Trichophaea hybrida]|nr:hypothetical protein BDD12DRAFT_930077 [Trichophaea hybrida]